MYSIVSQTPEERRDLVRSSSLPAKSTSLADGVATGSSNISTATAATAASTSTTTSTHSPAESFVSVHSHKSTASSHGAAADGDQQPPVVLRSREVSPILFNKQDSDMTPDIATDITVDVMDRHTETGAEAEAVGRHEISVDFTGSHDEDDDDGANARIDAFLRDDHDHGHDDTDEDANQQHAPATSLVTQDTDSDDDEDEDDDDQCHDDPREALQQAEHYVQHSYKYLWEYQDASSAIERLKLAHKIHMTHLGESHQQTSWTMNYLGLAHWQRGIQAAAEATAADGETDSALHSITSIATNNGNAKKKKLQKHKQVNPREDYLQALQFLSQSRRSIILQQRGTTYERAYQKECVVPGRSLSLDLLQQRITILLRDYIEVAATSIPQYHRTWNMAMECEFRALTFANDQNLLQARRIYKKSQSMFTTLHRGIAQSAVHGH